MREPGRSSPGCFGLFLVVGLALGSPIVWAVARDLQTRAWIVADAELLGESARKSSTQDQAGERIRFTYRYQDRTYTQDTVTLRRRPTPFDKGRATEAYRRMSGLPAGTKVKCFVNPRNPGEAVLGHRDVFYAWYLFIPALFIAAGLSFVGFNFFAPMFAMALTVAGVAIVWERTVQPLALAWSVSGWSRTPCVVEWAEAQRFTHEGDDSRTAPTYSYRINIRYRYQARGRTYVGDRYNLQADDTGGGEWREEVVSNLRALPNQTCWVSPVDPGESVLSTELREKWNLAWGLIGLLFVVVGGRIFLPGRLLSWRRKQTSTAT